MDVLINLMQTVSCNVETYELAMGLVENGVNVSLILSEHIENKSDWIKSAALFKKMYFVDTHTSKKDLISKTIKFLLEGRIAIKKSFKGLHYDYLINTMGNYWDPFIPSLVNANEIVTYIHDPVAHSGTAKWKTILRTNRYKQADQIVVHTRSFIPVVSELYGFSENDIHYVPHSRLSSYQDCWVKEPCDDMYMGKTNFVFFGFIQKYKGLHVLAKAYKIVLEKGYNVSLTIAGNGDFSEYKQEFSLLDNVKIINRRIKDEEIGNLFTIPNAVSVLPYIDATQSGVIVTAMEFGTPIIASNTGGLREQLDDGKIGVFCEPGNADDLADKMIYLIDNKEEIRQQKDKMSTFLQTLNRDAVARRLMEVICRKEESKRW